VSRTNIPSVLRTRRGERGTRHALICVRRLLDTDLLMRALSAAAAHAREPEDAGREAKRDGEPDDRQHLLAHGGVDVVGLEHGFEDADEDNVDGCSGCRGGDYEDGLGLSNASAQHSSVCVGIMGTYGRHNRGNQASPATEDCEKSNNKLGHTEKQCKSKTPHHPTSHLLVRVESLLHVISRNLLRRRVLELPHGKGIEPKVRLGLGAPGDCLDARLVVLVALTVRPETDLVEIFEVFGGGGALEGLEEVAVELDVIGEVVGDVVWIFFEFARIRL
jgi:hypothetical protein